MPQDNFAIRNRRHLSLQIKVVSRIAPIQCPLDPGKHLRTGLRPFETSIPEPKDRMTAGIKQVADRHAAKKTDIRPFP